MNVPGRLEIIVAGEPWFPVSSLAACGPKDRCYVIHVNGDGAATIIFGDGTTGRRPPARSRIETRYQRGNGSSGHAGNRRTSSGVALYELWAQIGTLLARYQDQVASEAYLETGDERATLRNSTDLRRAIAGSHGNVELCLCLRPLTKRESETV